MTTTQDISPTLLHDQIAEFQQQAFSRMPAEVQETLREETRKLVATGITAQAITQGQQAPDFTLPDPQGAPVTLSTLLAQGPVVLTFYRGGWCPYCNLHLRSYQKILLQVRELGASLVAVSPETPDNSLSTKEKKELTFPVLSDVGNVVARHYGLVFALSETLRTVYPTLLGIDLPAYNGDDAWELPMPGTFVIDQNGTVRLAWVDADYTKRLEPLTILESLQNIVFPA